MADVRTVVSPVVATRRAQGLLEQGRAKVLFLDVPPIRALSEL